ncbi:UDP-N-acetyl-D-mannosaminuronic acid dehydrogenase [Planctomycetaceae bacterium SCGC AG-212-F19]|nr:UDP-N-acetyl-D-mannosaminuronic acid dehydrogenase [Planctomycetaceae bacterium SCGC AG-212-F19]
MLVSDPLPQVCVVGLGYIGLPTAAVLAAHGLRVVGFDVNPAIVATINRGAIHITEPELDELVQQVIGSGMLRATTAILAAETFIIAVPTPCAAPDHRPDLSCVDAAARTVAGVLQPGNLVILESTSPVGTTEHLADMMASLRPDLRFPREALAEPDVCLAYCPERVLPGKILRELISNDRLIGGLSPCCTARAATLYRTFVRGQVFETNARTAEMAKLAENAFRDVNIAFANELSLLCDRLGIDVWELIRLANRHPRVKILQPGPGVGGHCVAVDPWFLVHAAPDCAPLIRTAREVNDAKPGHVVAKIKEQAQRFVNPQIACLGLSFKADVDDLRESPAVEIVRHLATENVGQLLAVEPHIDHLPPALNGTSGIRNVRLVALEEAVRRADILVLLVNHRAFADIDRRQLEGKAVIDTRGVWR